MVKKERKFSLKHFVMLPLVVAVTLFLWLVPSSFFGIDGLTVVEQRTIAIFVFAALMWMFEVIPTWATSVITIVIMLLTISDSSIWFMKGSGVPADMGTFVSYKSLLATFADPVIMLFLGGFVLAIAATKVGLDVQLARVLLWPFGKKPRFVLLGFLIVIGVFSMFMSNTATAAMMLTFLAPVLKTLPPDGKGKIGLALQFRLRPISEESEHLSERLRMPLLSAISTIPCIWESDSGTGCLSWCRMSLSCC